MLARTDYDRYPVISDGTPSGTHMDMNTQIYRYIGHTAGKFFFSAKSYAVNQGVELYTWDGSTGSASLVKDINPGTNNGIDFQADQTLGTVLGNKVVFAADDGTTNSVEPWISDGTPSGTFMLQNINQGTYNGSNPAFLGTTVDQRTAFFTADDYTHGRELWTYNTDSSYLAYWDITPGSASSSIGQWMVFDNSLVFDLSNTLMVAHGSFYNTYSSFQLYGSSPLIGVYDNTLFLEGYPNSLWTMKSPAATLELVTTASLGSNTQVGTFNEMLSTQPGVIFAGVSFNNGSSSSDNIGIELYKISNYSSGIAEETASGKVVLYPNPAGNILHVAMTEGSPATITIIDINGRELMVTESRDIDISSLASGMYICMIRVGEGSYSGKFIKQ
jgi:ELWxxDGT repeat protein